MRYVTHKKFERAFKKLQPKIQVKFFEALVMLTSNKTDKRLRNHALTGAYVGYRSFDVAGDVRVIFEELDSETIKLVNIGTHSQLYG